MQATPTASRRRRPEPPPLLLGLRSIPLLISWRISVVRAGNLYPVIRQKTMKGGPLDRRLYGRKQSPPQGAGRPLGTRPAAIPPRPGTPGACRCCRLFPSLSTRRSEQPEAVSARKRPEAQKGRALPSPCGPPATSPGPTFIIPLSRRQRRVERDSNGHTGVWAHAPCPSPCQKLGTEEAWGFSALSWVSAGSEVTQLVPVLRSQGPRSHWERKGGWLGLRGHWDSPRRGPFRPTALSEASVREPAGA